MLIQETILLIVCLKIITAIYGYRPAITLRFLTPKPRIFLIGNPYLIIVFMSLSGPDGIAPMTKMEILYMQMTGMEFINI